MMFLSRVTRDEVIELEDIYTMQLNGGFEVPNSHSTFKRHRATICTLYVHM